MSTRWHSSSGPHALHTGAFAIDDAADSVAIGVRLSLLEADGRPRALRRKVFGDVLHERAGLHRIAPGLWVQRIEQELALRGKMLGDRSQFPNGR